MYVDRTSICHNACAMGEVGRKQRRKLRPKTKGPYPCRASRFVHEADVRLEDHFT